MPAESRQEGEHEAKEAAPLIVAVLKHYFPDWEAPRDNGNKWIKALCPFHGESNPSATVSYKNDAFRCFACDAKGDALAIIMREEGISYRQAVEHAKGLSPEGSSGIPQRGSRKSGRRASGTPWSGEARDAEVPAGVRKRSTPWS